MTNNLNPGVYVVLPGGKAEPLVPEGMHESAKHLGHALSRLVEFLEVQCALDQEQATWLAAAVVHSLPELFKENPQFLRDLSQLADDIKAGKHKNR